MATFTKLTLLLDNEVKYELSDTSQTGILFNAPRPLWGTRAWQGVFCHGIFYTVVAFNDPQREQMIMDAHENDAWVLAFVEEHVAKSALWDEYMAKFPDLSPAVFEDHWRESYMNQHARTTIEDTALCAPAPSPA